MWAQRCGAVAVRIDAVDFFYLSMPVIEDVGDGSQDVLLVRVEAGGHVGWGECEASPLTSIASLVAPMSHSACHPVIDSVRGQALDTVQDIARIGELVKERSFDLLQAPHTVSGIDIAMWDLLGHRFEEPVHQLLGRAEPRPRRPYASVLFGITPEETRVRGAQAVADGFTAVKFGWQDFGRGSLAADVEQLAAAREGIGDADLLVDAGMVWGHDPEPAIARVPAMETFGVRFIEEPFFPGADRAYRALKGALRTVKLAGGEGSHSVEMALGAIDHSGVDFIQIDVGRIGGITAAAVVADEAARAGVQYVNHTFTSHLALSASLQPYSSDPQADLCEYPLDAKAVSRDLTVDRLEPGVDGLIRVPSAPGLGMRVDEDVVARYLVDVEISVAGRALYKTPSLSRTLGAGR